MAYGGVFLFLTHKERQHFMSKMLEIGKVGADGRGMENTEVHADRKVGKK